MSFYTIVLIILTISKNCSAKPQTSRILGGITAEQHQFPYHADIRTQTIGCGAVIINNNWLLSAAHCVEDQNIADIRIIVGNSIITQGLIYECANVLMHPKYDPEFLENDIVLIKTKVPFEFNEKVQPIIISRHYVAGNENAIVCGRGRTERNTPGLSNTLQYVDRVTLSTLECRAFYSQWHFEHVIFNSTICTQPVVDRGFCTGDSGGSLVIVNSNNQFELIGIVSWIIVCGGVFPDAYVRITSFIGWIEQNAY